MHRAKVRFLACTFVRIAQSAFTEPRGRGVLGHSGTEGAVSAPLPLRFLKTCAAVPMPPTSMKKPYTRGNAATPIKGLIINILLLWWCCGDLRAKVRAHKALRLQETRNRRSVLLRVFMTCRRMRVMRVKYIA